MIFPHAAVITAQNIVRRNNEEYEKTLENNNARHDYTKQLGKGKRTIK